MPGVICAWAAAGAAIASESGAAATKIRFTKEFMAFLSMENIEAADLIGK
jgi:hypothetical protein